MSDDKSVEASRVYASVADLAEHIGARVAVRFLEVSGSRHQITIHGEVADEATARQLDAVIAATRSDAVLRNRVTVGWTGPLAPDDAWNDAMRTGNFPRAVELAAALEPRFLVASLWWLARRCVQASRTTDAGRFALRAITIADAMADDPDHWRGRSRQLLAKIFDGALRSAEAIAAFREALERFEHAGDTARAAEVCYQLALAMLIGQVSKIPQDEIEPLARRAITLLEQTAAPDPAVWCDAGLLLAGVLERSGRADEARTVRARAESPPPHC